MGLSITVLMQWLLICSISWEICRSQLFHIIIHVNGGWGVGGQAIKKKKKTYTTSRQVRSRLKASSLSP